MSSKVPDFANELFDKIARENGFNDFSVEASSGTLPGDGYNSDIFLVKITENESSKHLELLAKIAPASENHRREFFSDQLFTREAIFYQNFAPLLAKFQEEKQLPKCDQFGSYPKCYGAIIDDEKQQYIIVLEDLRPLNFTMWNKSKPTTIENTRMTMRELGKLHGFSIALKDQKPNEFKQFKPLKSLLPNFLKSKTWVEMMGNSYVKANESLKIEDHKNIARHIKSDVQAFMSHCFDEVSERVAVFCHGDCWNNNLLFRFNEEGAPEEMRFLDWQFDHLGSPAVDIVYNLFTSTDKALRDKEYADLIKLYYESLSKTVKLLGSDPEKLFTFDDLLSELKRCGVYPLLVAPTVLQILLADSSEVPDMGEMFGKAAEGEGELGLVTGLSTKGQSEFDRRINELFEDIVNLGYYQIHQK